MSRRESLPPFITRHSRAVIIGILVLSLIVGSGIVNVERSASLDEFYIQTTEREKLDYIGTHFAGASANVTPTLIIIRGENVLSKQSLLTQLEAQQALTSNETINTTLAQNRSTSGIANVIATAAIRRERLQTLQRRFHAVQQRRAELNTTAAQLAETLNETRTLQRSYDQLNRSYRQGQINETTYKQRAATLEQRFEKIQSDATASLSANQSRSFNHVVHRIRQLQQELDQLNASYAAGEINLTIYQRQVQDLRPRFKSTYQQIPRILAPEYRQVKTRLTRLQAKQATLKRAIRNGSQPPLSAQITQLTLMKQADIANVTTTVLSANQSTRAGNPFLLLPTTYESGTATANATLLVVRQQESTAPHRLRVTQETMRDIANQELRGREALVFGEGVINAELDRSALDSVRLVGPIAALFFLLILLLTYRDIIDVGLGIFGLGLVLLWTFGFMGWMDITFNQLFVAAPILVVGLAIDAGIHVVMRYRETHDDPDDRQTAMTTALWSVGPALVLATGTTALGFLSNISSPVPPVREFGVVTAVGILAALLIFGGLIPALKIEIDTLLSARGRERRKQAFGTTGGHFHSLLSLNVTAVQRAPWLVVILAVVVSTAGAYGAVQVDTTFERESLLVDEGEIPDWMRTLPDPVAPGHYTAKQALDVVNANFAHPGKNIEILVEGQVTDPKTLERIHQASQTASAQSITVTIPGRDTATRTPLTLMRDVAATNASFNATFNAADIDGDRIPDRNLAQVYDALYRTAPGAAATVLHRTSDGSYKALRLTVFTRGQSSNVEITEKTRHIAADLTGDGLRATATGQPILNQEVVTQLLQTVTRTFLITFFTILVLLMIIYRQIEQSATLGVITMLPIASSLLCILGTMYLLNISFNIMTGLITSYTIAIGVDYSIHLSKRYTYELKQKASAEEALQASVTGTGGALFGSAMTTGGGISLLVFTILEPLQQFGIVTSITIIYSFLATVVVLPSLLWLWTRYLQATEA